MDSGETGVLTRHPWVPRWKLSVADYHAMGRAGIFLEDDRVELIDGELIAMTPIGSGHSGTINTLNRLLVMAVGERAVVSVQNPIRLDDYSEPQPDFTLLRPRADDYRSATPRPQDVLLVIEVADSSLGYDRAIKVPLYARHGIPEFWIIDVDAGEAEIRREPLRDQYASLTRVSGGSVLEPAGLPGVAIPLTWFTARRA